MTLFLSDIHFGADGYAAERAKEAVLLDCLRSCADEVERLYLLGDVFDAYLEYPHLIPKGFIRFQGLLAEWTDRGTPVTYLTGNHDPWHLNHFERELGVRVLAGPVIESLQHHSVYLAHGDRVRKRSPLIRQVRSWMRSPSLGRLYAMLLPGDSSLRLARRVERLLGGDEPEPEEAAALLHHAEQLLEQDAADMVVMGHSHQPVLHAAPGGPYLNTGSWAENRTLGRLDEDALCLLHWNGEEPEEVASHAFGDKEAGSRGNGETER